MADGREEADTRGDEMLLRGSQGQWVQWVWEIKEVMGGWDSHIMQMASLETSTSYFRGGYAQHQTLFARTNFSARTMAAAGAVHLGASAPGQCQPCFPGKDQAAASSLVGKLLGMRALLHLRLASPKKLPLAHHCQSPNHPAQGKAQPGVQGDAALTGLMQLSGYFKHTF